MRVLVMGAGAVGAYYGATLALRGHEVAFVARGAHLAAMRAQGLTVHSGGQTHRLQPVRAVAAPAESDAPVDLVLFTVKGYDTDTAALALRPVIGPDTAVLTLLNGVDSADQLAAALGAEHVLAGTTLILTSLTAPGVIDQTSPFRRITFGELVGGVTPRAETIATALREAGVEVTLSPDPLVGVWTKFIMQAPHATMTTACDSALGPIRDTPEGTALYRTLIEEVVAVGRTAGVALPPDAVETTVAVIRDFPAAAKTSMQRDFEARRRTELDQLTGAVVRRGRALGVPTPAFIALYAVLRVRALAFGGVTQ
ncbi:MAG: 2-dehydropantoate 2-reductase [Chloroflexi bacterium]|nr:2-dehydropantoate 2-reductase [Chloroflexota bacterium]